MDDISQAPDFIPDEQMMASPEAAMPTVPSDVQSQDITPKNAAISGVQSQEAPDFIPEDQFVDDEEKFGTPGEMLKTAAEGAAKGILGPIAPFIEKNIMHIKPSEMRMREEVNPGVAGVGEALGIGASLFSGVGAGSMAAKLGAGAAEVAGLSKATGILGKMGAEAIDQAAQMAFLQGSDEISKMIINDPKATAENAVANVGLATALGGLTGAGIGAISPLWKASGIGTKAGQLVEDFKSRISFRQEQGNLVEAAGKEIQGLQKNVHEALDTLYSGEGGGLRGEMIQKALPEMSEKATANIQKQLQEVSDVVSNRIEKMSKDELLTSHTKKLERELRMFQETVTSPEANYITQYDAINKLKQNLQGYGKYALSSEESMFGKEAVDLASQFKPMLEDAKVWGEAANVQKEINSLYGPYKDSVKDITSKFMTKMDNQYIVDPAKVNTYINNLGKPNQEVRQEVMKNYLDRTEKIIEKVNQTFIDKGLEAPIQPSAVNVLRDSIGEKTAGAALADKLIDKELDKAGGRIIGGTVGGALGSVFGHGGTTVGVLAGEYALGPLFSNVLTGLTGKLVLGNTSAAGARSAIDFAMMAAKGQKMMDVAVKNVLKPGAQVLATKMIPSDKEREKLDKVVSKYQDNPTQLMQVDNGQVGHYLGEHQQALSQRTTQAAAYLAELKPKPFRSSPLDKEIPPSEMQIQRYNRALDIAHQPAILLQHIKEGTLQTSDMQDLRSMYPTLYQQFTDKLSNEVISMQSKGIDIPYKTKVSMSLFLGQALDSSMTPASIMATQPMSPQQQPQQGQPKPKPSAIGKSIPNYMTPTQAAEAHKAKK